MTQSKDPVNAGNLSLEPVGPEQKQPWQTPALQEADYDITRYSSLNNWDNAGYS